MENDWLSFLIWREEKKVNWIKVEWKRRANTKDSIGVRKGTKWDKKLKRFPQGLWSNLRQRRVFLISLNNALLSIPQSNPFDTYRLDCGVHQYTERRKRERKTVPPLFHNDTLSLFNLGTIGGDEMNLVFPASDQYKLVWLKMRRLLLSSFLRFGYLLNFDPAEVLG